VEGEVIDATDVAMLDNDTVLLSHCFRPSAVRACHTKTQQEK